jgi:asparagine synthase (glutamine-hydrolysing)
VAVSEDEAKSELRRLISQSVRRHMETDLHVAVFLSGGIDSSIILFEAAEVRRRNVTAFCVGTPGCEDLRHAQKVAGELGVELRHVPIEQKTMVDNIPRAIAIIESFEPNHIRAGTTGIALADFVSRERENFRVALVGEGADELFGGYEEFPDAIKSGLPDEYVRGLFRRFIYELHKTQLQRVDRTTMAYGIEARVPYLDIDLARFAMSLPTELKLGVKDGKVWSKYILRQAYSGDLPEEIVWRRKVPMGEGAGVGDNGARGPFYEYTKTVITHEALEDIQQRYPEFEIKTPEEAYYFTIFTGRFGPLELARHRPLTNLKETK